MTNSQRLAIVRAHFRHWLQQHGDCALEDTAEDTGEASSAEIVSESILIRDGFYTGRIFHGPGARACWFMEADELKIQDDAGEVLAVFVGDEITDEEPQPHTISLPMPQEEDDQDGEEQLPKVA